jgi:hypothetical protein
VAFAELFPDHSSFFAKSYLRHDREAPHQNFWKDGKLRFDSERRGEQDFRKIKVTEI